MGIYFSQFNALMLMNECVANVYVDYWSAEPSWPDNSLRHQEVCSR
jgi:hypothetical protein